MVVYVSLRNGIIISHSFTFFICIIILLGNLKSLSYNVYIWQREEDPFFLFVYLVAFMYYNTAQLKFHTL